MTVGVHGRDSSSEERKKRRFLGPPRLFSHRRNERRDSEEEEEDEDVEKRKRQEPIEMTGVVDPRERREPPPLPMGGNKFSDYFGFDRKKRDVADASTVVAVPVGNFANGTGIRIENEVGKAEKTELATRDASLSSTDNGTKLLISANFIQLKLILTFRNVTCYTWKL
jgi:hypothetical protein